MDISILEFLPYRPRSFLPDQRLTRCVEQYTDSSTDVTLDVDTLDQFGNTIKGELVISVGR